MEAPEINQPASCGCAAPCSDPRAASDDSKRLDVVWQRLVSDGETCPRCGSTQSSVRQAVAKLSDALAPLGVAVILEERELTVPEFEATPHASNEIWIAGRLLEDWLGASTGSSTCCSVCGDSECRTVKVAGETFEAVPEALILKAGLLAAASLFS